MSIFSELREHIKNFLTPATIYTSAYEYIEQEETKEV